MKFASLIVILNSYKKERKIKEHAFHPTFFFLSRKETDPTLEYKDRIQDSISDPC